MPDDLTKAIYEMFNEIFEDDENNYDFEQWLDEIFECISNRRWTYYSIIDNGIKKEAYIKIGTMITTKIGELDFGIKVSYTRDGNKIKNGLVKMAFNCGFLEYSFENRSCILQEIIGNVNGNIRSYEPLLYDLPDEVLVAMGMKSMATPEENSG